MTEIRLPDVAQRGRQLLPAVRRFARSHRGMLLIAAAVLAAGAALNWSWLVAVGIAPLLIAVGPCLVMCALGVCMMGGKKCKTGDTASGNGAAPDAAHVHEPDAGQRLGALAPLVIDGRTGDVIAEPVRLTAVGEAGMSPVGRRNPFKPQPRERRLEDA